MKKILFLIFISFIIIILQQTIFNFHFFSDIKPEFFTILVVNYAFWENNRLTGYVNSSIIGLIEDILTNQIFGLNILIKSTIFLIIFFLKEKVFMQNIVLKSFVTTAANFFEFIAIYILSIMFSFYSFNPFKFKISIYLLLFFIVSNLFILIFDKIYKRYFYYNEG